MSSSSSGEFVPSATSLGIPWNLVAAAWTTPVPGAWCNDRPQGSPLFQHSWYNSRSQGSPLPPSGEFVPSATPLGIPWNCAAIPLEHRCPPFLVSHQDSRTTFAAVLLEIPGTQLTLHQDRRRQPCLVIPGPQDSIFLRPSVGSHICTIRYPECVCVSH